ncbi:HIT-like domain-containing protein [Stachybotrys elegans]|uniref:Bis(5'-adenosyl)-triphosphatase n=1 Tax=Stachybotrys elegans TaxID=80388 RepID=A0A8K0WVZ8_9HYPO|nr:HIT-like domain-containing protein [Stachybotrys elegans]
MTSTKPDDRVIKFGPFEVTKQVFLTTPHSFGLVNLKPIIPGHILICPFAGHKRLTDLSPAETTDLFTTVQLAQRMLARVYFPTPDPESGSFTVAVQDGAEAGQTVPHVHVHIIPRTKGDLGRPDDVYVKMAAEDGNIGGALWDQARPRPGGELPRIEEEDRKARSAGEMHAEAEKYKSALKDMGIE